MADIVVGAEVVQHEIGLEVVEHHILHLALEGRLVGVDEVGPLLGDGLGGIPEGAGVEDVVVVQQGDEVAGGHLDALIGVAGDQLVLFQLLVADAGSAAARCRTISPTPGAVPASTQQSSQFR